MNSKSKFTSGQKMIFIAGALFCLMLISVYLLSGLYAKYVSNGNGDDTARVAKFDVVTDTNSINAQFANKSPAENSYVIKITNNSEVAVNCDLVLKFNTPVQPYLSVKVIAGESIYSPKSTDKNTLTFSNICTLAPNGAVADCRLVFTVTDWNAVTSEANGASVQIVYNFDGTLYCTQID